jgi:hypothetical protein
MSVARYTPERYACKEASLPTFNNQSGEGHVGFSELALCDVVQSRLLWHGEKEEGTSAKESFVEVPSSLIVYCSIKLSDYFYTLKF